jgi:hypothetical protein
MSGGWNVIQRLVLSGQTDSTKNMQYRDDPAKCKEDFLFRPSRKAPVEVDRGPGISHPEQNGNTRDGNK